MVTVSFSQLLWIVLILIGTGVTSVAMVFFYRLLRQPKIIFKNYPKGLDKQPTVA